MKTVRPNIIALGLTLALNTFAIGLPSQLFAQQAATKPQPASANSSSPTQYAENCVVKTIRNIRVPAEADGRITEMLAVEGSNVKAGDELAILDDTQAKLQVEFKRAEEREAELNAMSDVNLRDAKNSADSAKAEAEAYKVLLKNSATPYWEVEKKILEAKRAELRIELAEQQQDIAKVQFVGKRTEVALAESELKKRRIVAPFDGFVETRIAQLGEWVQPGTPVLQLVQLDTLRVEGDVDALRYPGQITVGTPAMVYIYAYAGRDSDRDKAQTIKLEGKVGFVSSEIDLNNRYRIWVEVKNERRGNEWVIKPGMEADVLVRPAAQVN